MTEPGASRKRASSRTRAETQKRSRAAKEAAAAASGNAAEKRTKSSPRVAGAANTNVPTGATGVVANVTATGGTTGSFITVYPAGGAVPNSSNVNFGAGETIPNLVTVKVPASGQVSFYNKLGNVDIIADAVGYYATT